MKITRIRRLPTAALLVLALAGPSMAGVPIDQQPLVVARPLPPNIMFILDDSGSMTRDYMPDNAAQSGVGFTTYYPTSKSNYASKASSTNLMAYNPLTTYTPWYNADGTPQGNASRTSVSNNASSLAGSTNLLSNDRCFHTPRTSTSDPASSSGLYRWKLLSNGTGAQRCTANSNCSNDDGCSNITSFNWTHGSTTVTRTIAQEWQNYANWYHYYRTRMKTAKAASTRAFSSLGEDFRLGFTTINTTGGNIRDIPVGTDNGLFLGSNRTNWFSSLTAAASPSASSLTPLRASLDRVGQYFRGDSSSGPWGPEATAGQYSCRQNFAILTTDGYWNSDQAATAAARGDNDSTDGPTITGPNGATYTYQAARPYQDGRANTLADVAMYYWKNDLRADLKNDVPTSANNPAFWQHMVTFGVSLGSQGTLSESDLPDLISGDATWPAPSTSTTGSPANIDDLWHATLNSRGAFILASNADEFSDAIESALGSIADRLGSGASLAANSTKLEQSTRTFQAQYWSQSWRGEMNAFQVDENTGELAQTPLWRASEHLPAHGVRNIWVHNPQGAGANRFRQFLWSNLGSAQQTALGSSNVLNYLRGNQSMEESQAGGIYRSRSSVLGDIVNSQPVYVGAPNPRLYASSSFTGGGASYSSYAAAWSNRAPRIYVGANDGMLHAFNATTGAETFAFVPNASIINGMGNLADPNYEHRYFVDGELTVADVYGGSPAAWRTVLVGTMGRGARAMFALDVTDPANPQFLWEISSATSATLNAALGNMLGKPIVAQIANGNWKVLVGNGANSGSDAAQLLMVDVFTGSVTAVGTGASGNNGLTSIYTFDSNRNGFADMAFGGDYLGNIWRFGNLADTPDVERLFRAVDPSNSAQPITAAPIAAVDPTTGSRWVFFGTGKYLSEADLNDDQVQTWYGIVDRGAEVTKLTMVQRDITDEGEINGFGARVIDAGGAEDMVGKDGWYIDLVSPVNGAEGERMVVPNQLLGQVLVGTSRIPDASDPCVPSGRGFVMAIAPFTGARLPQTFFDISRDGDFTDADRLNGQIVSGVGFYSSPNNPIFIENVMQVSLDDGTTRTMATQGTAATAIRQSWRELIRQ